MPLVGTASDLAKTIGGTLVQGVRFSSQVTPEITLFDPNAAPGQPGSPEGTPTGHWVGGFVRPTVTIDTAAGPVVVAPFGAPEHNYFWLTAGVGVAAALGLVTLIGWIARRTR